MKNQLSDLVHLYPEYNALKKKSKSFNKEISNKSLIISIKRPEIYYRYFYLLLKFFSIAGYSIYFPQFSFNYFRKKVFRKNEQTWNYFNLIFKEGLMIFGRHPPASETIIELNETNLSPDYFASLSVHRSNINDFYIPMTMHPIFYHHNYWNENVELDSERKTSIFMIGNFSSQYVQLEKIPFKIYSRINIYDFLARRNLLIKPQSAAELRGFINSDQDNLCVIANIKDFTIDRRDLRETLACFHFYLALPGFSMPLAHNLIEALSVGMIPVIQKEYAELMHPNLEHMKNAIVYNNLIDLIDKIDFAFNIKTEIRNELRKNVNDYYQTNLTPTAVVSKIETNNYSVLYLPAENLSVELFEKAVNS